MPTRVENINADMINWAIVRAGFDLGDFFTQNPKVEAWVSGADNPTIKQLEDFTKKVHVPFGYMFLNEPPKEALTIPFFRTGKNISQGVSLNVYHTVQMLQERQIWLTDYLDKSGYDDLDFVGQFDVKTDYREIVGAIRNELGLAHDWAQPIKRWEDTLNLLTTKIEEVGIIVTFNGVVGNSTQRKIGVDECRGFVLVNEKAPFLFVNNADAKAAQMFTIIHELAHIWLGESAGFDNKQMLPADDPIEQLCDKVAAEFLVPAQAIIAAWHNTNDIKKLSKQFKVSPIVIQRRALDLGLISRKEFFKLYNAYITEIATKKTKAKNSGGDFYATAKKRVSLRFASYINTAVKENRLLYRDAYRLTNLKGDTYDRFINEHIYGA